jgi:iron(III) transport system substrate-binding protein
MFVGFPRFSRHLLFIGTAMAVVSFSGTGFSAEPSGRVVLYNPGGVKLGQALASAFTKDYPAVTVDLINAGVGELFTRIKAERNRPQGDVLIGASTEAYQSDPTLFEPYKTRDDAHYSRSVVGPNNLFYGFNLLMQTFMVNTKVMPVDQAPKSWRDLGAARFKGKYIFANPSLSGSAYGQFAQILQLHGWDVGSRLIRNAVVTTSSKLVWQNVSKGEIGAGVTGDNNVVKRAKQGFPVVAVYPSEGTALRFSANALIKGAPNMANAKVLLDFINSREAHSLSVKVTSRRSVRSDVNPPAGQIPTDKVKTFDYDNAAAAKNRAATLKRFDEELSRK